MLGEKLNKPVHLEKSIKIERLSVAPGDLTGMHSKSVFKKEQKLGNTTVKPLYSGHHRDLKKFPL